MYSIWQRDGAGIVTHILRISDNAIIARGGDNPDWLEFEEWNAGAGLLLDGEDIVRAECLRKLQATDYTQTADFPYPADQAEWSACRAQWRAWVANPPRADDVEWPATPAGWR
jgi:hypothetical protein